MLKESKTQKGLIALIFLIILAVIVMVMFGVIKSTAMHGCVSKTANCFNQASRMPMMDMIVNMFLCMAKGFWCVIVSVWDMLISWLHHFL